jgi:hypothetical protein
MHAPAGSAYLAGKIPHSSTMERSMIGKTHLRALIEL